MLYNSAHMVALRSPNGRDDLLPIPYETVQDQERWLRLFEELGSITGACRASSIPRSTIYYWMEHDPSFNLAFDKSRTVAAEVLETEAWRRAVHGWREPIFYQGIEVGEVRRYDSKLLHVLLQAHLPHKYKNSGGDHLTVVLTEGAQRLAAADPDVDVKELVEAAARMLASK